MKSVKEIKKDTANKTTTAKTTAKKTTAKTATKTTAKKASAKATAKTTAKAASKSNKSNKENEYVNIHGLSAFQYGEKITADDGKINITAVNIALQATRIKRDRNNNTTIFNYLLDIDAGLCYAWQYMNAKGEITNFNNINKEDIEDAIADARTILISHSGEKYSQDIQKEARNAVGNKWTIDGEHKSNGERLLALSLEEQKENNGDVLENEIVSQSIFNNGDDGLIHNKNLIKAINSLELDPKDYEILIRVISGDSLETIGEAVNLHKSNVSRRYTAIIKSLQNLLVLENGKVKLAK